MRRTPVVVTGVGIICPLGRDKDEFWTNLVAGRSGVRSATDRDFAGMSGVFLGEVEDEWVTSQLPPGADGSVRMSALALVAAEQALRDAGLPAESLAGQEVGVGRRPVPGDDRRRARHVPAVPRRLRRGRRALPADRPARRDLDGVRGGRQRRRHRPRHALGRDGGRRPRRRRRQPAEGHPPRVRAAAGDLAGPDGARTARRTG
jgi:hypothetical protein